MKAYADRRSEIQGKWALIGNGTRILDPMEFQNILHILLCVLVVKIFYLEF